MQIRGLRLRVEVGAVVRRIRRHEVRPVHERAEGPAGRAHGALRRARRRNRIERDLRRVRRAARERPVGHMDDARPVLFPDARAVLARGHDEVDPLRAVVQEDPLVGGARVGRRALPPAHEPAGRADLAEERPPAEVPELRVRVLREKPRPRKALVVPRRVDAVPPAQGHLLARGRPADASRQGPVPTPREGERKRRRLHRDVLARHARPGARRPRAARQAERERAATRLRNLSGRRAHHARPGPDDHLRRGVRPVQRGAQGGRVGQRLRNRHEQQPARRQVRHLHREYAARRRRHRPQAEAQRQPQKTSKQLDHRPELLSFVRFARYGPSPSTAKGTDIVRHPSIRNANESQQINANNAKRPSAGENTPHTHGGYIPVPHGETPPVLPGPPAG